MRTHKNNELRKEDVGKDFSRTVKIEVDTGLVTISSPKKGDWNL